MWIRLGVRNSILLITLVKAVMGHTIVLTVSFLLAWEDVMLLKHSWSEVDDDEVIKNGEKSGSGDSSLFSSALGFLKDNKVLFEFNSHSESFWQCRCVVQKDHEEPVDDEELTRAHDKVYNKNDSSGITSKLLGSAAALEVRNALQIQSLRC